MPGKKTLTQRDFVDAGTAFLEDHSLSELTMRALGTLLGVDATACYRHFRSKNELLTAMVDAMLAEALAGIPDDLDDPRDRAEAQSLAVRRVMHENPQLASALAAGEGQMPNALELSRRAIENLRAMGLDGDDLVRAYQAMESYTMGATVFDMLAAPHSMEIRAARYAALGDPSFAASGASVEKVARLTDEAFVRGLHALFDGIAARTF